MAVTDPTTLDMALSRSPLIVHLLERVAALEGESFGAGNAPWQKPEAWSNADEEAARDLEAQLKELRARREASRKPAAPPEPVAAASKK